MIHRCHFVSKKIHVYRKCLGFLLTADFGVADQIMQILSLTYITDQDHHAKKLYSFILATQVSSHLN